MAFIDELHIHATAGHGGSGVVRWLHLKGKDKAGPAGGDGGRGGDIILEGVQDLGALANYRYSKKFRAENGESGGANDRHGGDGEPVVLKIPVGSVATLTTTGESFEILKEGQREVIMRGGVGGYGNAHFKGAVNQNPEQSTPGKPGASGDVRISLKLIANAGFIGFPNAGKSSLLNALTRAKSKVGAYPFTTLDPHLGEFYGYVLADIPGLIEGASAGKGLGSRFLKHIERTGLLVHLVSAEQEDPIAAYRAIREELSVFGRGLAEKPELLVLSKVDMLQPEEVEKVRANLEKASGVPVVPLSVIDDTLLKAFSDTLTLRLKVEADKE
ncbi:MAG: GTPase ObgE [Candidatus Pacebacteria bacterium]|nr:GTPase ObgE [Candidatus Paceibacterota bacterium]